MAGKRPDDNIYCSFCGKPQEMVGRLIAGNGVYICDQCIDLWLALQFPVEDCGEARHVVLFRLALIQ